MRTAEDEFSTYSKSVELCDCEECVTTNRSLFFLGMATAQALISERIAARQQLTEADWNSLGNEIEKALTTNTFVVRAMPETKTHKGRLH